jgi:peptide chain release factor 1
LADSRNILNTEKDDELREMAKSELIHFEAEKTRLEEAIKLLLIPKDP